MFSSFPSLSLPLSLPRILRSRSAGAIDLQSVEIHDVETQQEKKARTLRHLLKLNHFNHSILYHSHCYHNHMPHILGSAYLMGAKERHLNDIYESESKELEKWTESPGEVSKYQRAYVDFFEDEVILNGYDWHKVLDEYLFGGEKPLINCVVAGLGHPLIHIGYAYELSSRELAMEGLGLVTTSYNFIHKYLDDASYTKSSTYSTSSPLQILAMVASDKRLDGLFEHKGNSNIGILFADHEDVLLEHWNAWQLSDPKKQFKDSQHAASALLVASQTTTDMSYDFFLVHLLTTSHAVRILLPLIPAKFHLLLVRQWWLLALAVYIAQLRPHIDEAAVLEYDCNGRDWNWVNKQAIEGERALDAHYIKAIRAMREAGRTWGDENFFYLKSAVKFVSEFSGWEGFGMSHKGGAY